MKFLFEKVILFIFWIQLLKIVRGDDDDCPYESEDWSNITFFAILGFSCVTGSVLIIVIFYQRRWIQKKGSAKEIYALHPYYNREADGGTRNANLVNPSPGQDTARGTDEMYSVNPYYGVETDRGTDETYSANPNYGVETDRGTDEMYSVNPYYGIDTEGQTDETYSISPHHR